MKPSTELISYLGGWEGPPHLVPREDPVVPGVWDIGYGHVCRRDHPPITPAEAVEILVDDAQRFADIVAPAFTVELTQAQFDALVSITFNVGPGQPGVRDGIIWLANGKPSTLRRLTNSGDFFGAAEAFRAWTRAGGRVVNGLIKRREADRRIFVDADYSGRP